MEHPAAYARAVLCNLVTDGAGRRRGYRDELGRAAVLDEGWSDDRATAAFAASDAAHDVARALLILAPRQRAVLALRYLEDLPETETEVAEMLGCSVGTVKSTSSRALERLRLQLPPPDDGGQTPARTDDDRAPGRRPRPGARPPEELIRRPN